MKCEIGNILMIDAAEQCEALRVLPVRLLEASSTAEAIKHLKGSRINMIVSAWCIQNEAPGDLVRRIREAKPAVPILVVLGEDEVSHEVDARTVGVSGVVYEDTPVGYFSATVSQLLGLESEFSRDGPARNKNQLHAY